MSTPTSGGTARLPQAVLWDMDGTLVDTEPYWIECEFDLVHRFGGTWSMEQAHSLVGLALPTSAAIIARDGGVPLPPDQIIDDLIAGVIARVGEDVPWRPGARELLAALVREAIPNALVTMSYRRLAEAVIRALPPHSFGALVAGDDVLRGKPDPEPYLRAAARLGVSPQDCVAIEDSPSGVASARAAGVPLIAVEHLVPLAEHVAGPVLHTLEGLTPATLLAVADARPGVGLARATE